MPTQDMKRLATHARKLGLDLAQVLRWRLSFQAAARRHIQRPPGMLSMGDAMRKHGVTHEFLSNLRKQGLPTARLAHLVLVNDVVLQEWLRRNKRTEP